jgi:dienelactone hydrolase
MPAGEIVVFHGALGLRPGLVRWAERLRDGGYVVHTPDLYDGEVLQDVGGAMRKLQEVGFDGMLERSREAVSKLPCEIVYVGFSNGGACAELLGATRAGAKGVVLIGAPLMIRSLEWDVWPVDVPVGVHFSEGDPRRDAQVVARLGDRVRAGGASFEETLYPGACHHLADPDWPGYDPGSAEQVFRRVTGFLAACSLDRS